MLRVILFNLLLFAVPFAGYAAYVWLRRRAVVGGVFDDAPIVWLAAAGLVLVIAGFAVFGVISGSEPDGVYVPPYMEDGRIVPGRIIAPGEAAGD
jgi:hypothetical protein